MTGTEIGALLSIEQAILPQKINDPKKRNTVYAFIIWLEPLVSLLSGLPHIFAEQYSFNQIESIRPLFVLYSIIGLGVLGIYFLISNRA